PKSILYALCRPRCSGPSCSRPQPVPETEVCEMLSELTASGAPDANEELRQMTARLVADRIRPLAAQLDVTEEFPREIYQELARADLLGITVPESLGGPG